MREQGTAVLGSAAVLKLATLRSFAFAQDDRRRNAVILNEVKNLCVAPSTLPR